MTSAEEIIMGINYRIANRYEMCIFFIFITSPKRAIRIIIIIIVVVLRLIINCVR